MGSMSFIQERFSRKSFFAGLVIFALSASILGLIVVRLSAGYGKISLTALLAAPPLLIAGIFQIYQSIRTNSCSQCHQDLRAGVGTFTAEPIPPTDLNQILKELDSLIPTKETARPRLTVSLEYCPSCVSVGLVQAEYLSLRKKTTVFPEQELQGSQVRIIKDKLLL